MEKAAELLNLAPWKGTSEVSARPAIDISISELDISVPQEKLCIERRKEMDLVLSLVTENEDIKFYLKVE